MNRIEQIKAERGGLDIGHEIARFAALGWEMIPDGDLERLKWWGLFLRKQTPGFFMLRVRIPGGVLNAQQLRTLGSLANHCGRGLADLTTRQQVQLRWIRIEDVPNIFAELREAGLVSLQTGMDNPRNVIGCPVHGLVASEALNAGPVVKALEARIVGNADFANLPRKFNIAITGCRENCVHAETQDLALVPAEREVDGWTLRGFNVLVGGKLGSGGYRVAQPLDVFVSPGEAPGLCLAIAAIFRDHGSREARNKSRLAFLLEERGEAWLRAELEARLSCALTPAGKDLRTAKSSNHVGIFRQHQPGLNYVGLSVPVGRMSGDQLAALARVAEVYGTGEVRLTVDQNVVLPGVLDAKLADLTAEPLLQALRYDPPGVLRGVVSCTGLEYCNLAVIETKQRALALARDFATRLPEARHLRIHWSGCPAGCGNHSVADIGLVGTKTKHDGRVVEAVDVFVGGSAGPVPRPAIKLLERVPCSELPALLEGLARYGDFEGLKTRAG